uniref:Uncharacterized protein n=1 Tax=Arundo donax TaxID=35708 RepID=A0A0A9CZX0_ARUDO
MHPKKKIRKRVLWKVQTEVLILLSSRQEACTCNTFCFRIILYVIKSSSVLYTAARCLTSEHEFWWRVEKIAA